MSKVAQALDNSSARKAYEHLGLGYDYIAQRRKAGCNAACGGVCHYCHSA